MSSDFTPRSYQMELMKIALEKNTIIFLPTGAGKTFIALLVLKQMSGDLQRSYSAGGKISLIVVNTLALVDQHVKYIQDHTTLKVGRYTGEMNLDLWPRDKWKNEFDMVQVVILTSQVLINLSNQNFIDLSKVNLIVFDECHRGVNDQPMRQLMKRFGDIEGEKPRVLGLTAPLLNGNVKPHMVMESILSLETTYHSKVATVDGLSTVVGFSTSPKEELRICRDYQPNQTELSVIKLLTEAMNRLKLLKSINHTRTSNLEHRRIVKPDFAITKLSKAMNDLIVHIRSMGTYGGLKAILAHTIQMERLRQSSLSLKNIALDYMQSMLPFIKEILLNNIKMYDEREQIFRFSSDKVLVLLDILKEYKDKEDMCCLIFTKRRFTAKVIFYILDSLSKTDPDYGHIKANFMVGYNSNTCSDTRESLFIAKKNKDILHSFNNKEINVLVASNVLEEGIDIPRCTLVIKYDKPEDYRAYIQSKGRARHKTSLFNIIVEESDLEKYELRYTDFQLVERALNEYLIGRNQERAEPSQDLIEQMYEEDTVAPYYAAGPGSAQVNMTSAISLLCQYCQNLPSDPYTTYAPEWYVNSRQVDVSTEEYRVVILLPTTCPITDVIEGPFMKGVKLAKRTAALKACIMLHQLGELDEHMLPKKYEIKEEDVSFLFEHCPSPEKPPDFSLKNRRLHKKQVANCLRGQIDPDSACYLHVIELRPVFQYRSEDINSSTMYDAYTSSLCFGIVTRSELPTICDFPVFVTMGTIEVHFAMNRKQLRLTKEQVDLIRTFHFRVFDEVLAVLQPFVAMDREDDAEMLMLVPVDKLTLNIDFEMIAERSEVKRWTEPSVEKKMAMEVTQETYLRKIVVPWYRSDASIYVVSEVSLNRNAHSEFPNQEYSTFKSYFEQKHHIRIVNPDLPQLLVKAITRRLTFFKPIGAASKKRRDKMYEESTEYLLPELVVKQDFPASLWIQASFLPTILTRLTSLLAIEELRCKLSEETQIGGKYISERQPLRLDENILHYQPYLEDDSCDEEAFSDSNPNLPSENGNVAEVPPVAMLRVNKDFDKKLLEAQYPWKDEEEPKDIERDLSATVMDVAHYETFMKHPLFGRKHEFPNFNLMKRLALTYPRHYEPRPLRMLERTTTNGGAVPELCELYKAVTAARADDIVNLERLETLGDSFLKYTATMYVFLRFPSYGEGKISYLKGRLVSNRNLYHLAVKKNLNGILRYKNLAPKDEWLPPGYAVPPAVRKRIETKELSINALFDLGIPPEEQISGEVSDDTLSCIQSSDYDPEEKEECFQSMGPFLHSQYIGDKHVADVVESMIGAFVDACGLEGGLRFIEWVGVVPPSEKLEELLKQPSPNPVLNKLASPNDIERFIPNWRELQGILGYEFQNPAYLLQAVTHASYGPNRTTASYEKLELIGDAILDFLITCHIFETCDSLDPGQLTDLRSALVNNNTFASLLVRNNVHKYLLMINSNLQRLIDKFVRLIEQKNFEIDEEVLILLEEDDNNLAEAIDVPKILGDVFEAIAGAIYLDSNSNLNTVWDVFYRMMWKEIDLFSHNVPKNIVRRLFEWPGAHPEFGCLHYISSKKCMVPLTFMLNGTPKVVHGFGNNKLLAKKAAAKLALRYLNLDITRH